MAGGAGEKGWVKQGRVADHFEIAHPWVDTDNDGIPEDVHSKSRNWITSLSRILFYTRAEDFAILGHSLANEEVLEPASLEEMLDFVIVDDWGGETPISTGYGLGVHNYRPEIAHGQQAWGHTSTIQGYRAYLAHLPQQNVTIAVLSNSDND